MSSNTGTGSADSSAMDDAAVDNPMSGTTPNDHTTGSHGVSGAVNSAHDEASTTASSIAAETGTSSSSNNDNSTAGAGPMASWEASESIGLNATLLELAYDKQYMVAQFGIYITLEEAIDRVARSNAFWQAYREELAQNANGRGDGADQERDDGEADEDESSGEEDEVEAEDSPPTSDEEN